MASLLGANDASADTPPTLIKATTLSAPASLLGMTNPYLIASTIRTPDVQAFTLSRSIRDAANRLEKLARFGVDLNQRGVPTSTDKLQLRVQSRLGGGVLQLCYRR